MFGGSGNNISLIARQFFQGIATTKKSKNFYIEGNKLFSFGPHYALAIKTTYKGKALIVRNTKKYSSTTSGHISTCRSASNGTMTLGLEECNLNASTTDKDLEPMILNQLILNENYLLNTYNDYLIKPRPYCTDYFFETIKDHNSVCKYLGLKDLCFNISKAKKDKILSKQKQFSDAAEKSLNRRQADIFEGYNE